MIIKFHIIVEAVFSLRIVCLCVSVCFSTLQSLFLCGNTSTGRCSLSCLDSSRLLSSLFFFFCLRLKCSSAAVNSPAYRWALFTTVSGSVKDAITRMLPDSPCPCFSMILHSLYISVIRVWTAVLWCICLYNAQKPESFIARRRKAWRKASWMFVFFFQIQLHQ